MADSPSVEAICVAEPQTRGQTGFERMAALPCVTGVHDGEVCEKGGHTTHNIALAQLDGNTWEAKRAEITSRLQV